MGHGVIPSMEEDYSEALEELDRYEKKIAEWEWDKVEKFLKNRELYFYFRDKGMSKDDMRGIVVDIAYSEELEID